MTAFRLAVVYLHLLAVCVALGMVLSSDFVMVKRMWQDVHGKHLDKDHLNDLQRVVLLALAILWLTGLTICAIDWMTQGWYYFENPKLQVKILMVVLLTFNGVILHRRILPMLHRVDRLHHLSSQHCKQACFFGAVSGVTWLYAAFLGIARPLSWKYSFIELFTAYPFMVIFGYTTMLVFVDLTRRSKS